MNSMKKEIINMRKYIDGIVFLYKKQYKHIPEIWYDYIYNLECDYIKLIVKYNETIVSKHIDTIQSSNIDTIQSSNIDTIQSSNKDNVKQKKHLIKNIDAIQELMPESILNEDITLSPIENMVIDFYNITGENPNISLYEFDNDNEIDNDNYYNDETQYDETNKNDVIDENNKITNYYIEQTILPKKGCFFPNIDNELLFLNKNKYKINIITNKKKTGRRKNMPLFDDELHIYRRMKYSVNKLKKEKAN